MRIIINCNQVGYSRIQRAFIKCFRLGTMRLMAQATM